MHAVPSVATGQARRLTPRTWAAVRLATLLLCAACTPPSPQRLATDADVRYGTHGFTWLAGHDPSALVAWGITPARLRAVAPDARVVAARGRNPCSQALAAKAALFVVVPGGGGAEERRRTALDCGLALYRDARVLVIAPR